MGRIRICRLIRAESRGWKYAVFKGESIRAGGGEQSNYPGADMVEDRVLVHVSWIGRFSRADGVRGLSNHQ